MKVGLIGPPEREELARLALRLEERGAEGVLLDPRRGGAVLTPERIELGGHDVSRFKAFYVADMRLPAARVTGSDGAIDEEASRRAAQASRRTQAALEALFARLSTRARVVNLPRTWDLHALKPFECATYVDLRLPVPSTLASTDPDRLCALARHANPRGGGWVRKGMAGGYGYTTAWQPPARRADAEVLTREMPAFAQEHVAGENVRAFVAGGVVVGAAEVVATEGDGVDSRLGPQRLRRIELTPAAQETARAAAAHWGMHFTAVDFMRTPEDEYVVLECNSAPFFVEFERRTGVPVSAALADLLTQRARSGSASA